MRGTKSGLISILAVGLLAGSAVVVSAQDEAEPTGPVEFTATWSFGPDIRSGTTEVADGVVRSAGSAWRPGGGATDPRLRGTLSIAANNDDYGAAGGPTIFHSAFRIENEEGAWQQQPYLNIQFPEDDASEQVGVFVGEGGYEGLFAVFEVTTDVAHGTWDFRGAIIEGELPPVPEPVIGG